MATGSGEPNLSVFQLEVARLFFALPASQGPPKTSTSSPLQSTGMSQPRAMLWRPRPASEDGPRSGSMTVTRSAGWLSVALMLGS